MLLEGLAQFLLEVEVQPQGSQCLCELFEPHEPISIQMQVFEFQQYLDPKVSLSVTDGRGKMLAHKMVEAVGEKAVMVFNNEEGQELTLCIENQTLFPVSLEMDIKFGHLLSNREKLPTVEDYQQVLDRLEEVDQKMETSHSYFVNNEDLVDQIMEQGAGLELSLTAVSLASVVLMVLNGVGEYLLLKRELRKKKNF